MDNAFKELLCHRRSIRKYTGEGIPEEMLELVVKTGLMSPRGRNLPTVELVVVKDKSSLEFLSGCRPHGPGMLAGADVAIVVLGKPEVSDVCIEDCCAAMTVMHLMADSLGLGSCWVQIRNRESQVEGKTAEDVVKEHLGVPAEYNVEAILSLGMPADRPAGKCYDDVDMAMVHREKF